MQAISVSPVYFVAMKDDNQIQARGQRLRNSREKAGLTQRELAARLELHHSNIGYWERSGNLPGPAVLIPMAKVLGVTASSLIGEDRRSTPASKPIGRARMAFEAVSRLPKRQQQKIVEVVEAFVAQQSSVQRQSA